MPWGLYAVQFNTLELFIYYHYQLSKLLFIVSSLLLLSWYMVSPYFCEQLSIFMNGDCLMVAGRPAMHSCCCFFYENEHAPP